MISILRLITSAITIYSFLCFIRIILTWIPSLSYSSFARLLASICDPYLNLFRRLPLRFGAFDFSPLVSFGVLMLASSIFGNLAASGSIRIGGILAMIIYTVWSIIASLLTFFIIFLIIRLIAFLTHSDSRSNIWNQIDYTINPIIFRISRIFSTGKPVNLQTSLIISIIVLIATRIAGSYLISILATVLSRLPI